MMHRRWVCGVALVSRGRLTWQRDRPRSPQVRRRGGLVVIDKGVSGYGVGGLLSLSALDEHVDARVHRVADDRREDTIAPEGGAQ